MFFDVADFCDFCYEHYDYKMAEIVEKNGILEHAILWKNDFTSAWNWEGRSRKGYETQFEIQTNDDLEDNLDKYCKNRDESTMCYQFIFEQSKYVCKPKYELVPNLFPDIIQQYANHCVERGIFFSCYLERKKGFALLITTENSGNEESETELKWYRIWRRSSWRKH